MRVLVLEDEEVQGDAIIALLQQAGYKGYLYRRGDDAISALRREMFDLALIDWQTPGVSGRETLSWMRNHSSQQIPVIFVSQRDDENSIVEALTAGADDYLTKPIRSSELMARISAVMRRKTHTPVGSAEQTMLNIGPLSLNRLEHTATINGNPVDLTQKEFELAWYLLKNTGRLVPRAQALQTVWGINDSQSSRTLDTHISRLRRKLNLTPENGFRLISIYNYGYRMEYIGATS
ncbi:MAG: response regulator transcription factor [Burkholderiales bacterium]|nr:response regulator transcription factor [Burkholderiales bacterium]